MNTTTKQIDFFSDLKTAAAQCVATTAQKETFNLREGLTRGIELILACHKRGKKLIFVGNGGSAAIASHMSTDYWKNGQINAIAFNDASLLTCLSNDYGYEHVFAKPLERFAQKGDLVIAISSSGKSVNILNAVDSALKLGCSVLTLSGFEAANPLRTKGELNFYIPSLSYGIVEVSHLSVLHAMLDEIMESNLIA